MKNSIDTLEYYARGVAFVLRKFVGERSPHVHNHFGKGHTRKVTALEASSRVARYILLMANSR